MTVLYDSYQRPVSNIRISLSSACNLRCIYCHREGENKPSAPMSTEDIKAVIDVAAQMGVKTVKFTGGEPLLRKDICDIINSVPKDMETSITTNGILLSSMGKELFDAGLSRVNISIDSLNRETYKRITGVDALEKVLDGIITALDFGLIPVKLNTVLLKGINEDEIDNFIEFSSRNSNVILQLIELMDFGDMPYHVDISPLEEKISKEAKRVLTRRMHHRKKYYYKGAEIEFVKPLHNSEFCKYCNRLRVTSDGKLKPCLLRSDNLVDINGLRGEELVKAYKKAVNNRSPYNS